MRFGLVGPSYTARSTAVADEECINLFLETRESSGAMAPSKEYGGASTGGNKSLFGTPGLEVFGTLPEGPTRGSCDANGRIFEVGGSKLCEIASDGTPTVRATIANDSGPVSIAASNIQLLIVSAGKAYCYTLATNALVEVTSLLVGTPVKVDYSDGYFIISFSNSNKFQISDILDGTTWPGLQVNAVSVFPENISSIIVNHRELWVFGAQHAQPYQNTGSTEIFDVIPGALLEMGCAAPFSPCLVDNSVFWINQDKRGGRSAYRAQGYIPQRISTHAVEIDLAKIADISGLVSYAYQDGGHMFWVLYLPGSNWSWTYDVSEGTWHKRASWMNGTWGPHWSWNYVYAFGKHLVGDWNSANIYELSFDALDDAGTAIRRLRRSPTVEDELEWVTHTRLTLDFDTGQGPQPPLTDGDGNPRSPQVMVRWSDDRGKTWSNEHTVDCGMAGETKTRVILRRLGRSRGRVYEISMTDPIPWTLVDGYMETA